jgi:hypothetical protein
VGWQRLSARERRYTGKADAFLQLYPGPTDEVAMRSAADFGVSKLPEWPKYADGAPVLHLDHQTTSRPDENRGRYEFWCDSEK